MRPGISSPYGHSRLCYDSARVRVELDFSNGDVCVMRLSGRFFTGSDLDYLREKTTELKASGCAKAVADFSDVPYVDSTGIGFIVSTYTTLTHLGGKFALAHLTPRVREVLTLTRLIGVIPIYDDVASAVAAFRAAGLTA